MNINEETNDKQINETSCSSRISKKNYDNYPLNFESSNKYKKESNIYNNLWTLEIKPPTYNDALNFIDEFKNIHNNKRFQLKQNNVIENIRKDLLSLSFPVVSDFNFFASESNIILEPLKHPPSYLMAFKWLETRYSKCKRKKQLKIIESNKRKGIINLESISKPMLTKNNHSTPNFDHSKLFTSSPHTLIRKEKKCFKSKRKLSTLFLDSLNVRKIK